MDIRVLADPTAVAHAVARELTTRVQASEHFSLALSGGKTPKRLYETLAEPPYRDEIPWHRMEIFFGDERAVSPDHPDSNYRMAYDTLLSNVPARAHRMKAELGCADEYQRVIEEKVEGHAFDLVLLGIGTDGHTASLFPGTAAVNETSKWVGMNDVPQLATRRMTFTFPLINGAKRVWILSCGADKKDMVDRCFLAKTARFEEHPVVGVRPTGGELVLWLDEAARGNA